ncbi:hypothetical protein E3983_08575 [Legionella israelensis]|uniref:Substrate of the Dot/Icm secretion system n=1 Tax=Legionella israelensis TaxID=454 RepID=A0AAX1EH31_9GAMM|nr:hypothetical protein [Legionella israelensis]QBR84411.1 hypothetical protein E3983_08575 [Legionella israelensis]
MPGFTFLKLETLQEKYFELTAKLMKKHNTDDVNNLPEHRQAQLARIEEALHQAEDLKPALFNNQEELEQYQSAIVLRTYLDIKKEIETKEYYTEGYTAAVLKKIPFASNLTDPSRSELYKDIDVAMGVSEENSLDEEALHIINEVHSTIRLNQAPLPKIRNLYETGILPGITENSLKVLHHVEADSIKPKQDVPDQIKDQIKTFDKNTLSGIETKEGTWEKNDLDQTKDTIKVFDKSNLKKTDTRESTFDYQNEVFTYQGLFHKNNKKHPQPTNESGNTTTLGM